MQIIVEGTGKKIITPDEVILNLKIKVHGDSYEKVLDSGTKFMDNFINKVLLKNKFVKDDLKTRSFVIKEEQEYNELTRKYETNGYSYNQNCILKFDYCINRVATIVDDISKLKDNISCKIDFSIKNETKIREKILELAFVDAKEKATIIAKSSNMKLTNCLKVDFKPIDDNKLSETNLEIASIYTRNSVNNPIDALTNSFTPEDIEICETIYCLWNAE